MDFFEERMQMVKSYKNILIHSNDGGDVSRRP